jgi:RimJ/RimL family protein N-acetyltransferase
MDNSYAEIDKLKQQKVLEIVSSSFYKELVKYGIDKSDIVSVSMNLLDYATENKNGSSSTPKELYEFKIEDIKDNWNKSRSLILENVSIKELAKNHIETIVDWLKANEIHGTFIGFFPKEKKALLEYLLKSVNKKYFAIYFDDKFVGIIGAERINKNFSKLEMKKFIGDKEFRGKGIAKSSTFLFLYYAFRILDYNKVYIHSMDTNIKNINLNSHFGFNLEGLLYNEVSVDDVFHDVIRMGLLKKKWQQLFGSNKK